jgi:hypothetical protein
MTLYKVKGRSKKLIPTLKKKLKRKLYLATWKKKQLRILQSVTSSTHFVKKFTWKSQETLRKKKLIVKKRHVFQYTYKQQKHMRALRHMVKSKLPRLFFEPWKKTKLIWTEKQKWLHVAYNRYRLLRLKDRVDFFRTYVGKLLLETELASHGHPQSNFCWLPRRKFWTKLKK